MGGGRAMAVVHCRPETIQTIPHSSPWHPLSTIPSDSHFLCSHFMFSPGLRRSLPLRLRNIIFDVASALFDADDDAVTL